MSRSTEEQDSTKRGGRPEGLPKRWSAQRKAEVVLRLLRGEDIGEVSREIRVAPPELERSRREFLDGGKQGLKKKNRPGGELMRTRAKLGEMTMRVELQAELLEKRGYGDELRKLLRRLDGSPATRRPYPLTMVCETWKVARLSVYALRARLGGPLTPDGRQPGKRGPKTALSDEDLIQEIRTVLKASPFLGEGHRKVKARLAATGIRVGKNRVLRLMRESGLLAPVRRGHPRGDRTHSGRIRTERPDELWGTDASRFWTRAEGWCWFFAAVDHWASACGTTGARSTGRGSSRPRSNGSARSRRSASICTTSRPSSRPER